MVINGSDLLKECPIRHMVSTKIKEHGVSRGLSEAGYDIRIKQHIRFTVEQQNQRCYSEKLIGEDHDVEYGRFVLASTMEEFEMPDNLVGVVHDKSTWARRGLSVFNTVIEPGWNGFLTLELVYHGNTNLIIPAGAGIAQVIFHDLSKPASYEGKYQDQEDRPIVARES